jgi:hypothetical protein
MEKIVKLSKFQSQRSNMNNEWIAAEDFFPYETFWLNRGFSEF